MLRRALCAKNACMLSLTACLKMPRGGGFAYFLFAATGFRSELKMLIPYLTYSPVSDTKRMARNGLDAEFGPLRRSMKRFGVGISFAKEGSAISTPRFWLETEYLMSRYLVADFRKSAKCLSQPSSSAIRRCIAPSPAASAIPSWVSNKRVPPAASSNTHVIVVSLP